MNDEPSGFSLLMNLLTYRPMWSSLVAIFALALVVSRLFKDRRAARSLRRLTILSAVLGCLLNLSTVTRVGSLLTPVPLAILLTSEAIYALSPGLVAVLGLMVETLVSLAASLRRARPGQAN